MAVFGFKLEGYRLEFLRIVNRTSLCFHHELRFLTRRPETRHIY